MNTFWALTGLNAMSLIYLKTFERHVTAEILNYVHVQVHMSYLINSEFNY